MDELQRAFYIVRFQLDFHRLKGSSFQDWFVSLCGYAFGSDFEEVRAYGAQGDLKCDGRRVSTKAVFQCYAPYSMKDIEVIAKVGEDFHGARGHWQERMAEWIFVHNDARGLPPKVTLYVDELRAQHPNIRIETWSEPELQKLVLEIDLSGLQALFGFVPSLAIVDRLVFADLMPIIHALARAEPDAGDPPLTPPSLRKLEKNALSPESALFLRIGRRKSNLVGTFISKTPRPDLGERIAEAFRAKYAELKSLDLPAETIFKHLQDCAGANGEPKQQAAALAVLSYFFDTCDLFEDPASVAEPS
jgi:hypothetical protein